jgi:hypothetical protein
MVRVKLILLVLLAAMLAVGPAFHNHSLIPAAGADVAHATNFCAACVGATARITSPAPAVAIPIVVSIATAPSTVAVPSADASGPVPSRAPPAC